MSRTMLKTNLCLVLSKPGIVKGSVWCLRFDLLVLVKQTVPADLRQFQHFVKQDIFEMKICASDLT